MKRIVFLSRSTRRENSSGRQAFSFSSFWADRVWEVPSFADYWLGVAQLLFSCLMMASRTRNPPQKTKRRTRTRTGRAAANPPPGCTRVWVTWTTNHPHGNQIRKTKKTRRKVVVAIRMIKTRNQAQRIRTEKAAAAKIRRKNQVPRTRTENRVEETLPISFVSTIYYCSTPSRKNESVL